MAATITNTDSAVSAAGGATYTFSTRAIGTATSTRFVVVCVTATVASTAANISSVTIGGVTATPIVQKNNSSGSTAFAITGIYILAVSSGTTATIVVNFSASASSAGISLYALDGLSSGTAFATNSALDDTGAAALTLSLNVPSGGVAVGVFSQVNTGTTASCTWTGLTKDVDVSRTLQSDHSTASGTTSGTPLSITATPGTSGFKYTGCTASWSGPTIVMFPNPRKRAYLRR